MRVTAASLKRLLAVRPFLPLESGRVFSHAEVLRGVSITETRPTRACAGRVVPGPASRATYSITWYQGRSWGGATVETLGEAAREINRVAPIAAAALDGD